MRWGLGHSQLHLSPSTIGRSNEKAPGRLQSNFWYPKGPTRELEMGFLQGDVVEGQRLVALNWQRAALDLVLGKNPLLWEGWGAGISCPEKLEVFKVGWGLEQPSVMESVPQSLRTHIPCSWNQAELSCRREMKKKPDIYISWCLFRQLYQSITEWNNSRQIPSVHRTKDRWGKGRGWGVVGLFSHYHNIHKVL